MAGYAPTNPVANQRTESMAQLTRWTRSLVKFSVWPQAAQKATARVAGIEAGEQFRD
jgi:hypothetical protein